MSHFYGTIEGNRGESTRCGTQGSGMLTYAAGWQGAIRVSVQHDGDADNYIVELTPWQSSGGQTQMLATGKLDATASVEKTVTLLQVTEKIRQITRTLDSPAADLLGGVIALELCTEFC